MFFEKKYYTFGEIIRTVKNEYINNGESSFYSNSRWCVYSNDSDSEIELNTKCFIDDLPDINDQYEEVYPDFVRAKGLELLYRCDTLQDIISVAVEQKSNISDLELLQAIKYYDDNDEFMFFSE